MADKLLLFFYSPKGRIHRLPFLFYWLSITTGSVAILIALLEIYFHFIFLLPLYLSGLAEAPEPLQKIVIAFYKIFFQQVSDIPNIDALFYCVCIIFFTI